MSWMGNVIPYDVYVSKCVNDDTIIGLETKVAIDPYNRYWNCKWRWIVVLVIYVGTVNEGG